MNLIPNQKRLFYHYLTALPNSLIYTEPKAPIMSLLKGFIYFIYILNEKWPLCHYLTASSFSLLYTERKVAVTLFTWGHHLFLSYIPIEKRPMSFINGLILFSYIFRTKSGHMLLLNGLIFFSISIPSEKWPLHHYFTATSISLI